MGTNDKAGRAAAEVAAVEKLMLAAEEVMKLGVSMAAGMDPEKYAAVLRMIRAGEARPVLSIEFERNARVSLVGVGPDLDALFEVFAYEARELASPLH